MAWPSQAPACADPRAARWAGPARQRRPGGRGAEGTQGRPGPLQGRQRRRRRSGAQESPRRKGLGSWRSVRGAQGGLGSLDSPAQDGPKMGHGTRFRHQNHRFFWNFRDDSSGEIQQDAALCSTMLDGPGKSRQDLSWGRVWADLAHRGWSSPCASSRKSMTAAS